jgi:hypothetical protein
MSSVNGVMAKMANGGAESKQYQCINANENGVCINGRNGVISKWRIMWRES